MQIDKRNRTELKTFFVKNAIPTEGNFADLIDGMLNQRDDGVAKLPGDALALEAVGDATSQKKALQLYTSFTDDAPSWVLSLNPRQNPADAATSRPGLSVSDGAGNSRLFIERTTGRIGVGTVGPVQAALHIDRGATNDLALLISSSSAGWGSGLQLKNTAAGVAKTFGIYTGAGSLHITDVDAAADRLVITSDTVAVPGKLAVTGAVTLSADLTLRRHLVVLGTTDGTTASAHEVVGGIGFLGLGQSHGQLSYRAGDGFELINCSDNTPRVGYGVSDYPFANLKLNAASFTGAIMPSVGNTASKGIQFPANPGGGSGDEAFLRYYPVSGEACKLVLGINDDLDDTIGFWQGGAERMTVGAGWLDVGSDANPIRFTSTFSASPDGPGVTNRAEIANDTNQYKTLMLVGNRSSGTRRVSVWDRLEVNGALQVNGSGLQAALHIDRGATNDLALLLASSGSGWGSGLQLKNTAAGVARTFGIYTGAGSLHVTDVDASADRLVITSDTVSVPGKLAIGTSTATSDLTLRRDAAAGLGPVITLTNGASGAGAGGAIDFNGYNVGANPPTLRLQSLDDGNSSSHFAIFSKTPGAVANPLVERMRVTSTGVVRANRFTSDNALLLGSYTTLNPSSNVYLHSPSNDRDAWIYLDSADTNSNWGIYHRQINTAIAGLPANSIGFIGGGGSALQAYVSLSDGSASFGDVTTKAISATGITIPGAGLITSRIRPLVQTFQVGGRFDRFYPVVFYDDAWDDGALELHIVRSNTHQDSDWRGATICIIRTHSSAWGHGSSMCKFIEHSYHTNQFVGGARNSEYGVQLIVWLRGGGTSYQWRSNHPARLIDATALESRTLVAVPSAPSPAETFNAKTTPDANLSATDSP